MIKFEYNENPYQKDRNQKLPAEIAELLKQFKEIGELIKSKAENDTGYKGGIKTTSYRYEVGRYKWGDWHGDDESGRTLFVDGKLVAKHYDCYGVGKFEYDDEKTIKAIHSELSE